MGVASHTAGQHGVESVEAWSTLYSTIAKFEEHFLYNIMKISVFDSLVPVFYYSMYYDALVLILIKYSIKIDQLAIY